MTSSELITLIESMTGPELDRLNNALRSVKMVIPPPAPAASGTVLFDCQPPNGDYLPPDVFDGLKKAAGKAGVIITVLHGSSMAPGLWDWNHGYGDADVKYQDTPEASARMFLAIVDEFKKIQRSTLPNPTPRQRLSAATTEYDAANHDTHAHVPTEGGQIVMSSERRREILDAAGRM